MSAIRKQEEKHTPEPWACTKAGPVMNGYSQGDAICSIEHNTLIAGCFSDVRGGPEVAEYNARRIVACVNACQGVDTAALSELPGGKLSGLMDFMEFAQQQMHDIRQQRDELLALLQRALSSGLFDDMRMFSRDVRAALAKAAPGAACR